MYARLLYYYLLESNITWQSSIEQLGTRNKGKSFAHFLLVAIPTTGGFTPEVVLKLCRRRCWTMRWDKGRSRSRQYGSDCERISGGELHVSCVFGFDCLRDERGWGGSRTMSCMCLARALGADVM